jgi:hypothetical protein
VHSTANKMAKPQLAPYRPDIFIGHTANIEPEVPVVKRVVAPPQAVPAAPARLVPRPTAPVSRTRPMLRPRTVGAEIRPARAAPKPPSPTSIIPSHTYGNEATEPIAAKLPPAPLSAPFFEQRKLRKAKEPSKTTPIARIGVGWRSYLGIAVGLILVGCAVFAQWGGTTAGQLIIGMYAVAAIIIRVPSSTTFKMALGMLLGIVLTQIIKFSGVGEALAIYAFLLMAVGTLQAVIELRHTPRPDARYLS